MVGWAKAHHLYSLEIEERAVSLWAFVRKWEKDTFRRVAVAVTDRFSSDATHNLSVLGSIMAGVGGPASLVAIFGGSHMLADTYGEYLGKWYSIEYPLFDLRLLKRGLQKVSFSIFGFLFDDGISFHAFEGGRASRLDDLTLWSSSCHHYGTAVNAVSS